MKSGAAWGLLQWVLPVMVSAGAFAGPPRQELTSGRVRVVVEPRHPGMRVLYDGIEVIRHSELVITTPGWAPHYYVGPDERAVAEAVRETVDDGERLRLEHHGVDESFEGVETITLYTDGRIEQVFEARFLKSGAEALMQWRIGGLNPTLIVGRPYTAELADGKTVRGVVPVTARSADRTQNTLARGFRTLEFDSRLGPVRIDVEGERELIAYDYRKDRWATPDDPYFWFGDLGTQLKAGQTVRYRIVYHLPTGAEAAVPAAAVSAIAAIEARPDVQTYAGDDPPVIIPRPKEARFDEGAFRVTDGMECTLRGGPDVGAAPAALRAFLDDRFGVQVAEASAATAEAPARGISFAPTTDVPTEGYRLGVSPESVRIEAADVAGFRHAVQTLKQLTTRTPDNAVVIRAAEIRDWPALRFRGLHQFTGGQGPDLHLKLLHSVIAALKLNHLVLECEYIEWDSCRGIHHPQYGMSKDDVRRIVAACRAEGVEITPLVMSLGHCQWIFTNDQNLDLAEDPEAKWAYCVTNPRTYEFMFAIYAEALELFQPKWFHIGHDEFTHRGRFPFRPSSLPYTAEQLLVQDTRRLHAWLGERGVRAMMWGDMLLGPGEAPDACHAASRESAAALRGELPDDIIIADWHYVGAAPAAYGSLATFQAAGHEAVACTWDRPEDIINFARAAYEQKSLGLLQTTWAGYSLDPQSFQQGLNQYAAYVLAAEAAWNADRPVDAGSVPWSARFLELMELSTLRPANRAGWTADLRGAYNTALAAADARGWFELGPGHDLRGVPSGRARLNGVAFQIAAPDEPSAIVLRSKLTRSAALPETVELTVGRRGAQLVVLHTTNFACPRGAPVGEYVITYDDGTTATAPVVYGRNVLAYNDCTALAEAPVVWSGTTGAGEAVALRALVWSHPQPERVIRTLTLRSADAAGALMVVGLSGLE